MGLIGEFDLYVGLVDGAIVNRRDQVIPNGDSTKLRTVITRPEGSVMLENGVEIDRIGPPVLLQAQSKSRSTGQYSLFSRVDFNLFSRGIANGLFTVSKGRKASERRINYSQSFLSKMDSSGGTTGFSIIYDDQIGAVVETELEKKFDEDESVSVTSSPIIWMEGEVPVVIGKVEVQKHKFQTRYEVEPDAFPTANPDDIPVITMEELKEMEAKGAEVRAVGRPDAPGMEGVKDYTLTSMDIYENVIINGIDESVFSGAQK